MRRSLAALCCLANLLTVSFAAAAGDPQRGGQVYRACVACHALEPGLHLTGPSLGGVFGRLAGKAEGYVRYSRGLVAADFSWNAEALDGWLADPKAMIPDTYMVFAGIDEPEARADLISFLEIAGAPGGGDRAVAERFIPEEWVRAQAPEPLRDAPQGIRIATIRHCGDSYVIRTEEGTETSFWEKNVRLKIDSAETGPPPGVAVILGAGMQGDRVSVIFASLADLKNVVGEAC